MVELAVHLPGHSLIKKGLLDQPVDVPWTLFMSMYTPSNC